MRTLKRAAFLGVIAFAAITRADAPTDQYAAFGSQNVTILDVKTHLIWTRAVGASTDHATAVSQCALNSTRLPSYRELLSIVDENPHNDWDPDAGQPTARFIDPNAFPGTPAAEFWTLSPAPGSSKTFMVVDFGSGEAREATTTSAFVRCVADD